MTTTEQRIKAWVCMSPEEKVVASEKALENIVLLVDTYGKNYSKEELLLCAAEVKRIALRGMGRS